MNDADEVTSPPRRALVTGANRGIGAETARALGHAGLRVYLGSRSAESGGETVAKLKAEGIDARLLELDVREDDSVAAAAKRLEREEETLDVLVNNAGLAAGAWNTSEIDPADAAAVFEVNVFGVLRVTNAFLPLLRRSPTAHVVNVSSEVGSNTVALDRSIPLWPIQGGVYAASKAALNRLTLSYAKEFQDSPPTFNLASPGYCATDMNGHSGGRSAQTGGAAIARVALSPDPPTGVFFGDEDPYRDAAGQVPW